METFLEKYHPYTWTADFLQYSWVYEVCRADGDEELLAYFWLTYAQVEPEQILEFHACIVPEYRKKIWTRTMIHNIADSIVEDTGCMKYIAQCNTPALRKLWRFMGWEVGHIFAKYTVPPKETDDGRTIQSGGTSL